MYPPPIYATDPEEVAAMLRRGGLGTLVTYGSDGFRVTHMPLRHDEADGAIVGHISRSNPESIGRASQGLVIFHGPDAYVTPSFYPSKARHGRLAPTWNYVALHVHGLLEWIDDTDWLRANLEALTDTFETGRDEPWKVSDAPEDFAAQLLPRICGLRLRMDRVDARSKLSQERKPPDRQGVLNGLADSPDFASQAVDALMAAATAAET